MVVQATCSSEAGGWGTPDDPKNVYAAQFVSPSNQKKVLLVNRLGTTQQVALGQTGTGYFVDEDTQDGPARRESTSATVTLKPFAVAVVYL